MDHEIEAFAGEERRQGLGQDEAGELARGEVAPLLGKAEPVADGDGVTRLGEVAGDVRPDEPGAAGDEDPHGATLPSGR